MVVPRESFVTFRALERFLPGVSAFVILQYVLVTERSRADSAGEHLVPSVLARLGADRGGWTERSGALHRGLDGLRLRLGRFPLGRLSLLRDSISAATDHVVIVVVVVHVGVVGPPRGGLGAQRGRHGPR